MRRKTHLPVLALLLALALPLAALAASDSSSPLGEPGQTAETAPAHVSLPIHMDKELAREHESFSSFAHAQVERMNANILGGKHHMQVHKGSDGLYRASYKAIDLQGVVCQVRRSPSNPLFYVGNLIYKEQVLESVAKSPEDCRRGPFEPVTGKTNRLIYTSKRGGGWN